MAAGEYFGLSPYEQYLTSFYFTITTITTVGYGDITISTWSEKIFCTIMMIMGVMTFSFASGSLASIIQSIDNQNATYKNQLTVLNKIFKDYSLPIKLYARLKSSLKQNGENKDLQNTHDFMAGLPHKLKLELSVYIYQDTYQSLDLLFEKSSSFIAWICPLFKPQVVVDYQYIYFEGDEVAHVYFLQEGSCGYVLPKHDNFKYVNLQKGNHFGFIDILGSIFKNEEISIEEWFFRKDKMKRHFTLMSDTLAEMLVLSI